MDSTSPAELPRWLSGTALALSVALVIGVLIAAAVVRSRPPDPVPLAAIPAPAADSADCRRLLSALPDELDGSLPRRELANPAPGQNVPNGVAAWGDPPVVLYCGLARPAEFTMAARLLDVSGVQFLELDDVDTGPGDLTASTWVAVDRPVYIAVTLPPQLGSGPFQHLAEVIGEMLPRQELDPSPELPR